MYDRAERFDDAFTTEDEYNALVRLYKLSSEYFAEPYDEVRDDKGCVTGYDVEQVEGETLENFGTIPEDTNFGIKANIITNFLESNNVRGLPKPNETKGATIVLPSKFPELSKRK